MLNEIVHLSDYHSWDDIRRIGDCHRKLKDYSIEAIIFILSVETIENSELVKDYLVNRYHLPQYFTGKDLMELGLKPGPFFSELFLQLEIQQLNGDINSKKEAEKWIEKFVKV